MAGVHITDAEFERTVLRGISDWLAAYASQLLGNAALNGKFHVMSDIIKILSEEVDHVKARNTMEQPPAKSRKVAQTDHVDEALTVTNNSSDSSSRHRNGKCHHCGREGHWVRECRTKKREDAAAAAAANSSR